MNQSSLDVLIGSGNFAFMLHCAIFLILNLHR